MVEVVSSDAVAGLVGAVVGGVSSLAGTMLTNLSSKRTADKAAEQTLRATAVIMQDDFLHYQSTLAKAIDRCTWWDASELLIAQSSVEDRKLVWASVPGTLDTNCLADAQGWMDFLIGSWTAKHVSTPQLTDKELTRLQTTFDLLKRGRHILADVSKRPYTDFDGSPVFDDLTQCKTVADLRAQTVEKRAAWLAR